MGQLGSAKSGRDRGRHECERPRRLDTSAFGRRLLFTADGDPRESTRPDLLVEERQLAAADASEDHPILATALLLLQR